MGESHRNPSPETKGRYPEASFGFEGSPNLAVEELTGRRDVFKRLKYMVEKTAEHIIG